jgi:peroxin-2
MSDKNGNRSSPPIWKKDYENNLPLLNNYSEELVKNGIPKTETFIMKANQLDSLALDEEVYSLLQAQLFKSFKFFKRGILNEYKPEINALLQLIIFKFSIFDSDSSYGQQLQNLIYIDAFSQNSKNIKLKLWQKVLFAVFVIFGKWFCERLNYFSIKKIWALRPSTNWKKKASDWMLKLEKIYKALNILNFVFFFYETKYISLVNRVLGMRLVYNRKNISKALNFEYMNRQLVWHGFTEFLLVAIPLVNFERIKSFFTKTFRQKKIENKTGNQNQSNVQEDICLFCSNNILVPYQTNCDHTFCYYCLKTETMMNPSLKCPECNTNIKSFQRKLYN